MLNVHLGNIFAVRNDHSTWQWLMMFSLSLSLSQSHRSRTKAAFNFEQLESTARIKKRNERVLLFHCYIFKSVPKFIHTNQICDISVRYSLRCFFHFGNWEFEHGIRLLRGNEICLIQHCALCLCSTLEAPVKTMYRAARFLGGLSKLAILRMHFQSSKE